MRVSIALLPALVALAAGRCKNKPSSSAVDITTGTAETQTVSVLPTVRATSDNESSSSTPSTSTNEPTGPVTSATDEATLTSKEPTATASAIAQPTVTVTATEEPTAATTGGLTSATAEDPATTATEEPTAVTTDAPVTTTAEPEDTTTSAAPEATPTTLGFCMKFVTPDVANYNYHVRAISPTSNQITEAPTGSNFGHYNIDISTGRVTLNNTAYAGYELYTPAPYDNQVQRVTRFTNTLPDPYYPFRCSNPDGVYASGSILQCSVTAPWNDGVLRTYNAWWVSESNPVSAFSIWLEDYVPSGFDAYDVAMFFGEDCTPTPS